MSRGGRVALSSEKRLMSALWMMATSETYRSIASRFGCSESTVHCAVRKVILVCEQQLVPKLINWPTRETARGDGAIQGIKRNEG